MLTAVLIALSCGLVVGLIVLAWRGDPRAAVVVGGGIADGPARGVLLRPDRCRPGCTPLKLDPKIAAGPITLALTDVLTLVAYFGLAALVL